MQTVTTAAGGPAPDDEYVLPAIPASAGALIFDRRGRLLIVEPTYKSGWTIPGGVMEADGETPWQACQREVREECALDLSAGTLVCMDFRLRRENNPGGIRFLFDCGQLPDAALARHQAASRGALRLPAGRRYRRPCRCCASRSAAGSGPCASGRVRPASTPSSIWRTAGAPRRG